MFWATFKTTLKTIVRSAIFWITIILLLFIVFNRAIGVNHSYSVVENNKIVGQILDTDPEYEMNYKLYIQRIMNATRNWVMMYGMPLFCVITTMLVVNRDFNDGFYEIEKSSGQKAFVHLFGRLTSLVTVNIVVCLFCSISSIYYYYFSRGGIDSFTTQEFIQDSMIRILRVFVCAMLPAILFFIMLTLVVGIVLKNGFIGGVVGVGYVLFEYLSKNMLRMRFPDVFHDYLTPKPNKLYYYWGWFDTEWFTEKTVHNPFTDVQMIISIASILVVVLVLFVVSLICFKHREI